MFKSLKYTCLQIYNIEDIIVIDLIYAKSKLICTKTEKSHKDEKIKQTMLCKVDEIIKTYERRQKNL